MRAKVVTDRN